MRKAGDNVDGTTQIVHRIGTLSEHTACNVFAPVGVVRRLIRGNAEVIACGVEPPIGEAYMKD